MMLFVVIRSCWPQIRESDCTIDQRIKTPIWPRRGLDALRRPATENRLVNEFLTWMLDVVQGVDPVVRTLIAGLAIMLETSVLVGLVVPGDTIVIVASTAVANPLEAVVLGLVAASPSTPPV